MEKRCDWANSSELERVYHDTEWGVAIHDEQTLFEMLILESMQAGLSWSTILAKRETLRAAYDNFDYRINALYNEEKITELLNDPGVIRNKLKVNAVVSNAKAFMGIQAEYGSFDAYIWAFVNGEPLINDRKTIADVPSSTPLSDEISKELKEKGFKFLGTTTVYAFMQSIGLVDDHLNDCFRK